MQRKKYKIEYTYSSRVDIRQMKKYILDQFKYRELGEDFTRKMKEAILSECVDKFIKLWHNESESSDMSRNHNRRDCEDGLFTVIKRAMP